MKKQYVIKTIVCIILIVILITGNIITSFATETGSGNDPGAAGDWSGAQKADYISANLGGLVANTIGVIFGRSSLEDLAINFERIIRTQEVTENVDYDTWWAENVGLTPSNPQAPSVSDPSDYNVTNINVSYEFKDILLQAAQETMAENPLGYVDIVIPSYNFLDTSSAWTSKGQYDSVKEYMSQGDGFYIGRNYIYQNKVNRTYLIYIPQQNIGLVGNSNGGVISSGFGISYNWAFIQSWNNLSSIPGAKQVQINSDGSVTENVTTIGNISVTTNITKFPESSDRLAIFSSSGKNQHVFLFVSNDAYKNYNSGSPQPYYVSSSYTGAVTSGNSSYSTSQINSGNSSYSSVVNNIQSGMTADEVIKLVDTIMNNMNNGGGSGGSGGGSDDDDDDGGSVIGNIIRKLGDFVSGLIDGIGDALESIVNSIVGYTDENGVEHPGIFQGLINLISSGVVGFLSAVFSFLPTEIVTVITAGIILSILFAVIHFIRGR